MKKLLLCGIVFICTLFASFAGDSAVFVDNGFSLDGKYYNQDAIVKSWNYVLNYSEYKMETIKEVLKRAKEFLNYLNKTYDNKNILIVSHGAFIKALYFNIIGYTENTNFLSFFPSNGEVLELEI